MVNDQGLETLQNCCLCYLLEQFSEFREFRQYFLAMKTLAMLGMQDLPSYAVLDKFVKNGFLKFCNVGEESTNDTENVAN